MCCMTAAHAPEPEPTLEAFGARLALIRWAKGWNIKEAALACRLPQASWREWELSHRAPRNMVEVAQAIADATGYSDYWIMTGRQSGLPHPPAGQTPPDDGGNAEPTSGHARTGVWSWDAALAELMDVELVAA